VQRRVNNPSILAAAWSKVNTHTRSPSLTCVTAAVLLPVYKSRTPHKNLYQLEWKLVSRKLCFILPLATKHQ
jgi:hypothetical protein